MQHDVRVGFYMFFPGGGIGRYTHELAGAMAIRQGVEVEVICSSDFEWRDTDDYVIQPVLKSISHRTAFIRKAMFLRGQFMNPWRCISHAKDRDLDLLHFANINHLTFPFWRPALERSGIAVGATAHDVRRQKSMISRRWEDRQLRAFYRYADVLFVHSEYQARDLASFAEVKESKIEVVPHGLYGHGCGEMSDLAEIASGNPNSGSTGLFFGQIRDEKNLDGLIQALDKCGSDTRLIVAGSSTSRHRDVEYYRALAEAAGVDDRVTFINRYIPDDEVGPLFSSADWVALPYRTSFTSQSGVLNTAAYYRKPVLVSSAPVLQETVETCDIGLACRGDSPDAIAEGIARMEDRLRRGHCHRFEKYKQIYSWEENVNRTLEAYRRVIRRKS